MAFRTVSTRLSVEEFTQIVDYCNRNGTNPSALIRNLIFEEITPSIPANVAGKNLIEYNKKKDSFSWYVELDNGERVLFLKDISPEYLKDLSHSIVSELTFRDENQGKKKTNSVPVPKKMVRK